MITSEDYKKLRNRIFLEIALDALSRVTSHTGEEINNEEFHKIEEQIHIWIEALNKNLKIVENGNS